MAVQKELVQYFGTLWQACNPAVRFAFLSAIHMDIVWPVLSVPSIDMNFLARLVYGPVMENH